MYLGLQHALVGIDHILEVDFAVDDMGEGSVLVVLTIEFVCLLCGAIEWHSYSGNDTA